MYKIINAIACKFRQLLHKHHINTLQAYWTGIQRYEEYRQCRYEPEGRLRVHTSLLVFLLTYSRRYL